VGTVTKLKPSPRAPWAEPRKRVSEEVQKKIDRIDSRAVYLARKDVWEAETQAARSEGQFKWRETQRLTRQD